MATGSDILSADVLAAVRAWHAAGQWYIHALLQGATRETIEEAEADLQAAHAALRQAAEEWLAGGRQGVTT